MPHMLNFIVCTPHRYETTLYKMVPGKVFSQTYVSIPLSSFLFCIQYHGKVEINIPTHNLLSRIKTYGIMYSDGNSLMIEGKK